MLEFSSSPQVKHSIASSVSNEVRFPAMLSDPGMQLLWSSLKYFECALIFEREKRQLWSNQMKFSERNCSGLFENALSFTVRCPGGMCSQGAGNDSCCVCMVPAAVSPQLSDTHGTDNQRLPPHPIQSDINGKFIVIIITVILSWVITVKLQCSENDGHSVRWGPGPRKLFFRHFKSPVCTWQVLLLPSSATLAGVQPFCCS